MELPITLNASKHLIKFGVSPNTWIDAYVVPELKEVRYAPTAMSLFVGKSKEYISTVGKKSVKFLERLQGNGYKGWQVELKVAGVKSRIKSLSASDFEIFVTTEGQGKDANPVALAHLASSFAVRKAELEAQLLLEVLGATIPLDKESVYSNSFEVYLEAIQANYDDWAEIGEQEEFIANPTVRWLNKLLLTATCYEDDPDCYHSKHE